MSMETLTVRIGDIGFLMTFTVKVDGTVKDLTTYDTNYLQVQGQADRSLTTVTASLGTTRWTTVATDWTGTNWTKPGRYLCQLKLTDAATPTVVCYSDPFYIYVKDYFEV